MLLLLEATAAALSLGLAAAPQLPIAASAAGSGEPLSDQTAGRGRDGDSIVVEAPLLYPSVGLMNDHMHNGGELMVGVHFERTRWSGRNQRGTDPIKDEEVLAAGYTARTATMAMDMVMLDVMYAPIDRITLMLMPHYMWHRMEMVGIDPTGGGHGGGHSGHAGHSLGFGEMHEHSTEGFGDTLASASLRLIRSGSFNAHMTMGVWVPTGSVNRKNPDGTFVHYGMQPGSGTWDMEPSITISGKKGRMGWGAQASYRWRVTNENESGFRFGDQARLNAWLSYPLRSSLGATGRLEYMSEGRVEGHYNAAHRHAAPPDRQENYGGKLFSGALGVNWQPPLKGAVRPDVGVELSVPFYQNFNGIQAPMDWRLSTVIRQTF